MSRADFALCLVLLPLVASAHCRNSSDGPEKSLDDAFRQAMAQLRTEPSKWQPALQQLEFEIVKTDPESASHVSRLRLEAAKIIDSSPDCRVWAIEFLPSAVSQVYADAAPATKKKGTRLESLNPVCPQRVAHRDPDGSFYVAGFATAFSDAAPKVFFQSATSVDPEEVAVFANLGGYTVLPDRDAVCNTDTGRFMFKIGNSSETFTLAVNRGREPVCVNDAIATLGSAQAACDRDCCRYESPERCESERCVAECRLREQTNPPGHPAIGDACSSTGAFYQWCRRECSQTASCRDQWCDGTAPQKGACLAAATSAHEVALERCPIVIHGCEPPPQTQSAPTRKKGP